jgi:hypothetical protein
MKTLLAILVSVLAVTATSHAAPLAFPEVSLLVRMGEPEAYVTGQLAERRLLRALTPEQEARLKTEGASASLLAVLRQPAHVLPVAEAVAFETWTAGQKKMLEQKLVALEVEQAERQAARAAIATDLRRRIEEKATAERGVDQASFEYSSGSDYYSGYPLYGAACRPARAPRAGGSFSLQWQNGTATTYTAPGLYYHPLGTNGSSPQPHASHQSPNQAQAPRGSQGSGTILVGPGFNRR